MIQSIFLGGSCGHTTWRTDIAIPILQEAGVPFHNPQLPDGAWTPAHQYAEMDAKNAADVWLFVFTGDTRGIASIGEVAYRIGQKGKIAIAIADIPTGATIDGQVLSQKEIDDLNRGRVFLKAMADEHAVPVFADIATATRHAVQLALQAEKELSLLKLQSIVARVQVPGFNFVCEKIADKYAIQIRKTEADVTTGAMELMEGRRWLIEPDADEAAVVRTLLKAAITWEEHEIREQFVFDGVRVFQPH